MRSILMLEDLSLLQSERSVGQRCSNHVSQPLTRNFLVHSPETSIHDDTMLENVV